MRIDEGFLRKPQILPIGKFFLEIGLMFKQIDNKSWYMTQNVWISHKNFENWSRVFKVTSPKAILKTYLAPPREIYFMKKSGGKGIFWWDIGEKWRKMAEVGLKLNNMAFTTGNEWKNQHGIGFSCCFSCGLFNEFFATLKLILFGFYTI